MSIYLYLVNHAGIVVATPGIFIIPLIALTVPTSMEDLMSYGMVGMYVWVYM